MPSPNQTHASVSIPQLKSKLDLLETQLETLKDALKEANHRILDNRHQIEQLAEMVVELEPNPHELTKSVILAYMRDHGMLKAE